MEEIVIRAANSVLEKWEDSPNLEVGEVVLDAKGIFCLQLTGLGSEEQGRKFSGELKEALRREGFRGLYVLDVSDLPMKYVGNVSDAE